ncbi:MAG: S8 family serine peptidase [Acidimicrobiia bacterium]|nr:S8 family serine peptidase [Acidimicrobiia bacterium]
MKFRRRIPAALALGVLAGALSSLAVARAAGPSNDYFWDNPPEQWGLLQTGAPAAWTASTGAGVYVGVVDSGIDANHEDLAGKVVDGANCVGSNGNEARCTSGGTSDVVGHGTHVAGIIAALTNNGIGVASMAPDAHLISAQAVGSDGSGSDADVGAAIRWVVDHGARVVNLSLGAETTSRVAFGPGFSSAVEYAWAHGAVPVVAAGNSAQTPNFGSLHMIVVGATTPTGDVASYSNHLDHAVWAVAAPGGASDGNPYHDVVSTYPNNSYATIAGTSMATAHVSGEVALLLAKGYGASSAVQRVLSTAVPCSGCGSGRIDAAAALGVGSAPPPSAPPGGAGGAGPPGAATVVGPPPRSVPASSSAPRAARPRPTTPPTTALTEPPSSAPTTTTEAGPVEAALGAPWPGQVQIHNAGGAGKGGSDRTVPVGLALVGLAGAAGALGVRGLRLRGT